MRVAVLATMVFWSMPSQAAVVNGLYESRVSVADRSERARNDAFPAALAAVAVRVTGRTDAGARLGNAAGNARRYVQRYGYAADGLLEVGFDAAAVTQLLEQLGLPVWGQERPSVAVVLPSPLNASPEARTQVEEAARLRGIPLIWTTERSEAVGTDKAQLRELARRYQADAVLVGNALGETSLAANLQWSFALGDGVSMGQGSLADGVSLAADACARVFAAGGSGTNKIFLDVEGIHDLQAYAQTLNYLGTLSMIKMVNVASLTRDVARFELSVRGDEEALRRTIALNQHLEANTGAGGALVFRYRP